jgi:hypothetical protein
MATPEELELRDDGRMRTIVVSGVPGPPPGGAR